MSDDGKMLLVRASAARIARIAVHAHELHGGDEASVLRALTPQSDGGDAIEVPQSEGCSSCGSLDVECSRCANPWTLDASIAAERDRMKAKAAAACCDLCGQPMPPGEEAFRYHGFSGPCPPKEVT